MTAESVCVSVSLTQLFYWVGAPNMLLFSNKWGVGMAHGGHRVYSCQDNSQAAAGLEFDLHTSAQSAVVMLDRKLLWLHFWDSYGLHYVFIPRSCAWSRNMWCTVCGKITQIDSNRTRICSCRKTHGGTSYSSRKKLRFIFMRNPAWSYTWIIRRWWVDLDFIFYYCTFEFIL